MPGEDVQILFRKIRRGAAIRYSVRFDGKWFHKSVGIEYPGISQQRTKHFRWRKFNAHAFEYPTCHTTAITTHAERGYAMPYSYANTLVKLPERRLSAAASCSSHWI
jgi:hypothetical protein